MVRQYMCASVPEGTAGLPTSANTCPTRTKLCVLPSEPSQAVDKGQSSQRARDLACASSVEVSSWGQKLLNTSRLLTGQAEASGAWGDYQAACAAGHGGQATCMEDGGDHREMDGAHGLCCGPGSSLTFDAFPLVLKL